MGYGRVVFALFGLLVASALAEHHARDSCTPGKMVVYKAVVNTFWSKQKFPKQYPLWRPPAQFSKFVGITHNSSVLLYRTGEQASPALRKFAEQGDSSGLELTAQGDRGILDQFVAPAVTQGEGSTHTQLFVDGVHSKVSLISKIVPSPDWFIGVDSLELCENGHWIDTLDVKLFPMDAGTDQGLAFTSPNWESVPHENIYQITSRRPNHPASSFHYPDLDKLPPLASLHLYRVRSYKLAHEFKHPDTVTYKVDVAQPEHVHIVTSTERSVALPGIQVSAQPAASAAGRRAALHADGSVSQVALRSDSRPTEIDGLRLTVVRGDDLNGVKVRAGDRQAIIEKITSHYHHKRRKTRRRRRKHLKRKRQFRRKFRPLIRRAEN